MRESGKSIFFDTGREPHPHPLRTPIRADASYLNIELYTSLKEVKTISEVSNGIF
jgi:hypothetical protein